MLCHSLFEIRGCPDYQVLATTSSSQLKLDTKGMLGVQVV